MNREEAIERIRDHMEVHRIGEYPHIKLAEALNLAISALRAQQTTLNGTYVSMEWFNAVKSELDALKTKQPVKLDRNRWEGCTHCDNRCCCTCKYSTTPETKPPCKKCDVEETYDPQNFCPECGRPLTEAAWTELERRIGGNDGTTDLCKASAKLGQRETSH